VCYAHNLHHYVSVSRQWNRHTLPHHLDTYTTRLLFGASAVYRRSSQVKRCFTTAKYQWNEKKTVVLGLRSIVNGDNQEHYSDSTENIDCYTKMDEEFLQMAVDAAQLGYGYTFPNPAVGCVIVLTTTTVTTTTTTTNINNNNNNNIPHINHTIIGRGYHPRAGYPHAEIFALLQAAKYVPCGIQAATSVLQHYHKNYKPSNNEYDKVDNDKEQVKNLYDTVASLTKQYQGMNGTRLLFENCLQPYLLPDWDDNNDESTTTKTITAYVTLEPCCHTGKRTPPCTTSFLVANGISRLVVGSRDPNPQVDGGGIQILQQQSYLSDTIPSISIVDIPSSYYSTTGTAPYQCNALITNFAKRITVPIPNYEMTMTGRTKRVLRTLASQMLSKNHDSRLPTVSWGSYIADIHDDNTDGIDTAATINFPAASIDIDELLLSKTTGSDGIELSKNEMIEAAVHQLEILPNWLEHVDGILWQHEVVLLRLNKAISKRKGTTMLGNRIAQQLQACVVQSKGHTVLLYRPSSATNPVIDIQNLLKTDDGSDEDEILDH
jgi:diaminohydroxyphosphoribosylaminopyrimidine deaminase/5-amino-6-(5-phosphoribosylamino)uracil reductase